MDNLLPQMENLLDKLKLLDYENEYVERLRMRPISRHYFALPSNPGEQFFSMVSLASWLLRITGTPFEQPEETDDPNSVTADITRALREMNYVEECRADKMRRGSGVQVIRALTFLCDLALAKVKFVFGRPVVAEETAIIVETNGAEIFLDRVEEETFISDDDTDLEDLRCVLRTASVARPSDRLDVAEAFDMASWRSEVERVAPALAAGYEATTTNWRANVEKSSAIVREASEMLRLVGGLSAAMLDLNSLVMDKIAIKETHAASRVEHLLAEHRARRDELRRMRSTFSDGVKSRTSTLLDMEEQVETVERETEERAGKMADGSRLVAMKQAMTSLGREAAAMDGRIAVLERCRMEELMRRKYRMRKEMDDAAVRKPFDDGL